MVLPTSFWENMAKRYPRYNDPFMQKDVQFVLDWVERQGITFEGCNILDIGCGTGSMCIPLAQKGARVEAIDLSTGMLDILKHDVSALGLEDTISLKQSDWNDFVSDASYDITLASMTPAISSEALVQKMIDATHHIGIYVGWGAYKNNAFIDALLSVHELPKQASGGCIKVARFLELLDQKSLPHTHTYFETSWQERYTFDEAKEYALAQLQHKDVVPDESAIEAVISDFMKQGEIIVETKAQKGVVLFSQGNAVSFYGCCPKNF